MNRLVCAAVLTSVAWAGAATAQEFKGAELSAEVLSLSEDDDISQTTYRASAEAGVWGGFGVAADLSFYDFGDEDSVHGVTVHALYDAFEFASLGAFYSRDSDDDADAETWGLEAGRGFGAAGVEAFLGFGEVEGFDYTIFGTDATYDLSDRFSLTSSANFFFTDDGDVNRLAIGGEYRFGNGPAVYAEIGRIEISDESGLFGASENYVGLGARIAIGPNDGTTFEARGFEETLSGF